MAANSINYTNNNLDLSVRVFDKFYDYDTNVPAQEYDIVYSYFLQEMGNEQIAGNFAVSLFQVAEATGIPVLTLLAQFQNEGQTQLGMNLNVQMAYYLNLIRSSATLLGVTTPMQPNYYAARNVVQ